MTNFVIIALGSNIGDRLKNITNSYFCLYEKIDIKSISPIYHSKALLPENCPENWDKDFYNSAICGYTELNAKDLHSFTKQVEAEIGKDHSLKGQWAPRIIDIDIIAYGQDIIDSMELKVPHPRMLERDFVVLPVKDICPEWKHPKTGQIISDIANDDFNDSEAKKLVSGNETKIQAIANITPDSFSDGGKYFTPDAADEYIKNLAKKGVDIIDIGAESTRPGAETLTVDEEWQRLQPVLENIKDYPDISFSLDSRNPENQKKALDFGVDIINDVSGFNSEDMKNLAAVSGKKVIFMHSLSVPADKENVIAEDQDPVHLVKNWAEDKISELQKAGIKRSNMIFDPGIGFGKTAEQSWEIIKRIDEFESLGVSILIGHSKKSFLTLFTDKPSAQRSDETLAISAILINKGIDFLRVHDAVDHMRLIDVYK